VHTSLFTAPCGTRLEVLHRPADTSATGRPPLVFVHGLFRAAWCWEEAWLPHFQELG